MDEIETVATSIEQLKNELQTLRDSIERLEKTGFRKPHSPIYRTESAEEFIKQTCVIEAGAYMRVSEARSMYEKWCVERSYQTASWRVVLAAARAYGVTAGNKWIGKEKPRCWLGIRRSLDYKLP